MDSRIALWDRVRENKWWIAGAAALAGAGLTAWKYYIPGEVRDTETHGGELVARVLQAHGVRFVFTLVGGHISPILVACESKSIRVIDVRHEATAVFAADSVARLSGVPGCAIVTAGPGVTNTITAIKNAQMAESPLVLLGGAAATAVQGRGALQDIDQLSLMKPIVKWAVTVDTVRDIIPTLRRAFQVAASGVPGPVFVELPIDLLYPMREVCANFELCRRVAKKNLDPAEKDLVYLPDEWQGRSREEFVAAKDDNAPLFLPQDPRRASSVPWIVRKVLEYRLRYLFAGAFDNIGPVTPLPVSVPRPTSRAVSQVLACLARAERPVILMQSQSMLLAHASPERDADTTAEERARSLADAVHTIGVPTFLGGMARGLLGQHSPLHIRQGRSKALKQADCILLLGVTPDFRLNYGRSLGRRASIITVNRNRDTLALNSDLFWSPSLAFEADPGLFVRALAEAVPRDFPSRFDAWRAQLKAAEASTERRNEAMAVAPAYGHDAAADQRLVNPLALFRAVETCLPDNAILIGDGGDFVATAAYTLRPRAPLSWLDPGAFGTLGVGGGFALGAKLCRPDAEVWLIWGDGSVGYSVAEFDTFKRHHAPIAALVGNDACWTQIEREQVGMLGSNVACPLLYTPYHVIAEGYGGQGRLLTDSQADIVSFIREAQNALMTKGLSVLLNVHIGKTSFREGSISV